MDFGNFLFVSDLDGSFLGEHGAIVERNLEMIEIFKLGGGLFTAATGRIPAHLDLTVPNPDKIFNAPAVMSNGACIYDFREEKSLFQMTLDPYLAVEALRFAHETDVTVAGRISTPDGLIANPEWSNKYVESDLVRHLSDKDGYVPLETMSKQNVTWYKAVFRGEPEALEVFRPKFVEKFGKGFAYTSSSPTLFEIVPYGCSKALGLQNLKAICEEKYGRKFTTVALGDYENDIDMLRAADISFAPANAMPCVKEIVDHVVCDFREGAVADAIEVLKTL